MKPDAKLAFDKWAIGVFDDLSDPSFEVIGVIAEDAWSEAWDTATASAWACAVRDAEAKTALLLEKELTQVISANHVSPPLMLLAVTDRKNSCLGCSCKAEWNPNSRFVSSKLRPRVAAVQILELNI